MDQFIIGTLIVLATVFVHVTALILLVHLQQKLAKKYESAWYVVKYSAIFSSSVIIILLVHTAEAWLWAMVYLHLGEFDSLETALYFSVVTSTTLGYGDITLSQEWQLLSTFEAMGGLILFGTSTAFMIAMVQELLKEESERS